MLCREQLEFFRAVHYPPSKAELEELLLLSDWMAERGVVARLVPYLIGGEIRLAPYGARVDMLTLCRGVQPLKLPSDPEHAWLMAEVGRMSVRATLPAGEGVPEKFWPHFYFELPADQSWQGERLRPSLGRWLTAANEWWRGVAGPLEQRMTARLAAETAR